MPCRASSHGHPDASTINESAAPTPPLSAPHLLTLTSASTQAAACRASAAVVELLLTTAPEVAEWRGLQSRLPLSLALLCEVR